MKLCRRGQKLVLEDSPENNEYCVLKSAKIVLYVLLTAALYSLTYSFQVRSYGPLMPQINKPIPDGPLTCQSCTTSLNTQIMSQTLK